MDYNDAEPYYYINWVYKAGLNIQKDEPQQNCSRFDQLGNFAGITPMQKSW